MKTENNLITGLTRDCRAYVELLAYAEQAAEEGLSSLSRLFFAASKARKVYAESYLSALNGITSSSDNLQRAIAHEIVEADELYPQFIETAKKEGMPEVLRTFMLARSAKRKNIHLFEAAVDELGRETPADYYVCQVCGYLYKGHEPIDCPICGKGPQTMERV